jgi:hypothetical protein
MAAQRTERTLLPRNIIFCFWYSFMLDAEWTPGLDLPEGLDQLKNTFTSSGLEPASFRLVV